MSFVGSSYVHVDGGAYNVVYGNQINTANHYSGFDDTPQLLRLLSERAAINACHDAEARYPQPNCHPNTRVKTLAKLDRWVEERGGTVKVCWVYGSAGVGKSAIAQKVSEDHFNQLVGAFFFSRNDSTRDLLDPFVATIVYQCCTSIPLKYIVGPLIFDVIRSNTNIFLTTSENQFRKLLLEPFASVAPEMRRALPNLITIDGLDECIDLPSQQRLLGLMDLALAFHTPVPFKFLLCSRPELQIRHGIDSSGFASCLERIQISGTTIRLLGVLSESDLDIRRYFLEKFAELRKKYRSVLRAEGAIWPSEDQVNELVWRASGQFIFAVTVIKYVDSMDERPQDRLRTILSIQSGEIQGSPYPDLDMLYRQIMLTCRNWDKIYSILQLLVTPHPNLNCVSNSRIQWHSPSIVSGLFRFKIGQVETLLSRLHSVIHVPEDPNFQIQILHASFTEFLLDSARSGEYWVRKYSESEYCNHVTVLLLRTLSSFAPWYPLYCSSEQSFDAAFKNWQKKVGFIVHSTLPHLSITHWPDYWCKVESPSASLRAELEGFDPYLIGALTLSCACDPAYSLRRWNDCLAWAKALDGKVPQSFIEKLDAFPRGCFVGYHKDTLRLNAVRGTFELECGFVNTSKRKFADCMVDSLTWYYKQWWSEELGSWDLLPMLLPATPEDGILFNELVVVHIPKANARTLKKVYGLYKSLKGGSQRTMFRNDIVNDTSKSAVCGLVEKEDLEAFKALLYEHRDIFVVLPTENSSPWSDSDLSVSDEERDTA